MARLRFRSIVPASARRECIGYVVVFDEDTATFACAVLEALKPKSYVVHLMDLFSDDGIVPARHPNLVRLLKGAAKVRCVSAVLGREISRFHAPAMEIPALIPARSPFVEPIRTTPITVITGGALYRSKPQKLRFFIDQFAPAWREFLRANPAGKILYTGSQYLVFPEQIKPLVTNLGSLQDEAYYRQLRSARCAVLPISHQTDEAMRFSIVSRVVDYLAAGLPVIALRAPGTGTGDFLENFENRGALLVRDEAECLATLRRIFSDDAYHEQQSRRALALAAEMLSPDKIRHRLYELIDGL